jgi:CPA1 family monovalent cation:H+ antiporter
VIFLLHGFVFILIGLQLPSIIKGLGNYPFLQILGYGLLISLVTIVVRIIWVFAGVYWQSFFSKKKGAAALAMGEDPDSTWKNVLIVAWTGTRGVISLATALAIPLLLQDGTPFPKRHSIIFLAFVVIFVTLVVQGLSLPLLIRGLKIKKEDNTDAEEKELQLLMANSTLNFIEQDFPIALDNNIQEKLKKKYEALINDLTKEIVLHKKAKHKEGKIPVAKPDEMLNAKLEISKFQRDLLIKLHKEGEFSDAALKKVEQEMDVDELKLNLQLPKEKS